MKVFYTLKSGKKIAVDIFSDILDQWKPRKYTYCYDVLNDKNDLGEGHKLELHQEETSEIYFEMDGQKIYVNDFEYLNIDELIEKFETSSVKYDEILTSFMKDADNIGLLIPVSNCNMGCSNCSSKCNKLQPLLYVPVEKRYKSYNWGYKIELEPYEKQNLSYFYEISYYFSDLTSLIKEGSIKLVNKSKYLEEKNRKKPKTNIFTLMRNC